MSSIIRYAKRLGLYLGIAVLGFLAGAHVLFVLWALNGPPLQPWHEIELAAEFTADQADQVRTLADYQALEARLFAELAHLTRVMGGKPVHIIGYSMGAALAVDYSLNARAGTPLPPPASLALISPAVGLARIADLTPWVERLGRLPGLGRLAWTAIMPEFDPFRYNSFTANAWTGSTNTAGARRTWSRPDEGRKVTSPQRSPGSTDLATTALPLTRSRRVWTKT